MRCWRSPVPATSGQNQRPAVSMSPSTVGMRKYTTSSSKMECGVFAAMWVNHRACFLSGPRHIRCFDGRIGKAMA